MPDSISVGRRVGTYLVLTFAFSSYFYFLIIRAGTLSGGGGRWTAGLMWCPAAAAIAASLLTRRRLAEIGWRWSWRYVGLGYVIPIAYASVAYGATWALGLGRVPNPVFLAAIAQRLHFGSTGANVAAYLALQATVGMVFSSLTALGEEIGWRGFLVPELARAMPLSGVSLVSGVVWASWHVPILLFADYHGATPGWYSLLCFSVLVLGASFVMAWLRLRSGSVWPAVVFHASHNLWIQTVLDPFTADTGRTAWIIGEFGAALALTGGVAGWLAWRTGLEKVPTPAWSTA